MLRHYVVSTTSRVADMHTHMLIIPRELDYRTELANAERFKELYSHMREIYVPEMYKDLTTAQVWVPFILLIASSCNVPFMLALTLHMKLKGTCILFVTGTLRGFGGGQFVSGVNGEHNDGCPSMLN